MTDFTLKETTLRRGGRISKMVWRQAPPMCLVSHKEEVRLCFSQGGPQRGTNFEIHIGASDFWTFVAAMSGAMSPKEGVR